VYLRGRVNILKRVLIHFAALNLGLLMRVALGVGTPRTLQGRVCALFSALLVFWRRVTAVFLRRLCVQACQAVIIHMPAVTIASISCFGVTSFVPLSFLSTTLSIFA
jgi:hypothetical protein